MESRGSEWLGNPVRVIETFERLNDFTMPGLVERE